MNVARLIACSISLAAIALTCGEAAAATIDWFSTLPAAKQADVLWKENQEGQLSWDGGAGTTWRTNPRSGVTGIQFTQRQVNSPEPPPVVTDFWAAVNATTAS